MLVRLLPEYYRSERPFLCAWCPRVRGRVAISVLSHPKRALVGRTRSLSPGESSLDAQRALANLSPQQRAVVYLTYWEDLTPAQIAELLEVSEGTVRKQLARAREQLRRILQ